MNWDEDLIISLLFRSGGGGGGVLDEIKAISAFNLVEVEVVAELGNWREQPKQKVPKGGKSPKRGEAPKMKKSTIQNVDYFETRVGEPDFQGHPKFKYMKYGLDFDAICMRYLWDIGNISNVYGWYNN